MADGVIIEGYGPGAKQWATELTQSQVLATLQKIGKLSEDQIKEIKKAADAQSPDELFKGVKKEADELEEALEELEAASLDSADATKKATKETTNYTKQLGQSLKEAGIVTATTLAAAGTAFATAGYDQLQMYLELNAAGMNLTSSVAGVRDGLETFGRAAETANLRFSELADLQQKYGNVMNLYGVQRFARDSQALTGNLRELGFTSQETAEFLSGYAETQRFFALQEQLGTEENLRRVEESARSLDTWSKVLGKSRTQLLDEIKASQQSSINVAGFMAQQMASGNVNIKKAMDEVAVGFGEAGDDVMELFAARAAAEAPIFQQLAITAPDALNALLDMRDQVRNGVVPTTEEMAKVTKMVSSASIDAAKSMGPLGDEAMSTILGMRQASVNLDKRQKEEAKEADKALSPIASMSDMFTRLFGSMERSVSKAVGTDSSMATLGAQMDKLANQVFSDEKLGEITDNIGEAGADLIAALDTTAHGILDIANDIVSPDYSMGEVIAAGLAGMFLSTTVVKAAGSAVLGGLGKLLGIKSLGGVIGSGAATAGGLSAGAALGVAGAGIGGYAAGKGINAGYEWLTGSSIGSDLFDLFTGGSQEAQVAAMLSSNVSTRRPATVQPGDNGAPKSNTTTPSQAAATTSSDKTPMDSINSLISVVQEQTNAVHRSNEQLNMAVGHLKQIRRNTEDN